MTKEQIEKAAIEYAESIAQSDERKMYCEEDFKAGANWRIESVYHGNTVRPDCDAYVLIEDIYGNIYDDKYYADDDEFESGIEWKELKRWAYIKDLIPMEE